MLETPKLEAFSFGSGSNTMASNRRKIDPSLIVEYASMGVSVPELSRIFGIESKQLEKDFEKELRMGQAARIIGLRKAQDKAKETLNPTMLIWLGKQELGQTDQVQIQQDGKIEVVYVNPNDRKSE